MAKVSKKDSNFGQGIIFQIHLYDHIDELCDEMSWVTYVVDFCCEITWTIQTPTEGVTYFMDGSNDTLNLLHNRIVTVEWSQFENIPFWVLLNKFTNFDYQVGNTIFNHSQDLN